MKSSPSKARWAVALAVVAACGVGAYLLVGDPTTDADAPARSAIADGPEPGDDNRQAALTVTVVEVEPTQLVRSIAVNGAIFAWQEVIIAPEVGGYRVADVNVDVGDSVSRGQELVRLSSELLEAELASRRALLKQREAELVNAEAALRRAQSLAEMEAVSASDLDALDSAEQASLARLESARAELETAQLRLTLTGVTAPDDGVITSRTVTVGQVAQQGSEMLRLLRQGRVEWRGQVPEARLAELSADQAVTVTTTDGARHEGTIRVVAPTVTDQSRTGLVYVDLPAHPSLRPGMFARGDIETGRSPGLTLPLESVVSADGYSYAFVLREDHTVERRRIQIGAVRDSLIEVTGGLSAGERVVAKGAGFLADGDLVGVADEQPLPVSDNRQLEANDS